MTETPAPALHYMIGGGIATLAAAAYLIRDAGVAGETIRILDDRPRPGGALDGTGEATWGYLTRGGRMFEPNFVNTLDLLSQIPAPGAPERSVTEDILAFNAEVRAGSKCRLIEAGKKADMVHLGLMAADIVALNRLMLTDERSLGARTIGSCFGRAFFDSNFWIMWSSMFSFQPWHSAVEMRRYLRRFIHLFPGFTRIRGILRTRYNQYDSVIAPLEGWLRGHGVRFDSGTVAAGLRIEATGARRDVTGIELDDGRDIPVTPEDRVFVTLGSMTDGATYGTNSGAPPLTPGPMPSFDLWRDLARQHPGFGTPDAFAGETGKSAWTSFTVTMDRPEFRDHMEEFTGNATGTGGLVTIRDSAWLMSFVLFNQPHFQNQPEGTTVFWGYGLRGDRNGDFVPKPMWQANGDEIIAELCWQLRLSPDQRHWFDGARVLPCRMPFITSQFMPRQRGDRPAVRPEGAGNFALMGQFVEQPLDTVFTVEYSVRSARAAVHALTGTGAPIPVRRSDRDPRALLRAARVLMEV
ncbi:oleate hydratase [Antarcticimicrobium luteum]|uniref:Oleate hydratase n=1 Tax=Antarcticimicrobium luteum TaxID=2547397 RepID=A0A4R5VEI5_9RHOB|nr:oleate hydratase [Antarcticimicrobium luteum]TDK50822.1 oleate hydratase [Antarcticimicrobium luteum]